MATRSVSELDELSERQRDVLRMIAAGRTNPEIAAEMGISLDGAKWHVREILSKLGVASREEAAAIWLREQRPAARAQRALAALLPASRHAWIAVGASVVAVVAMGVLATVLALHGDGDTPPAATPDASPSVAATATATVDAGGKPTPGTPGPTPTTIAGAIELRAGDPVPFPRGLVLYAVDASWEGPSAAFRRYYVDSQGELRTDTLLETVAPPGAPDSDVRAIVGVVAGPGGTFAAALCHGTCYGAAQPVTIVRSDDGGVTWEEVGTLDEGSWGSVVAVTGTGVIARSMDMNPDTNEVFVMPRDGTSSTLPPEIRGTSLVTWRDGTGKVVVAALAADGRLVDAMTGATLTTLPLSASDHTPSAMDVAMRGGSPPELVVAWTVGADGPPRNGYVGFVPLGASDFRALYHWTHGSRIEGFGRVQWLSPTTGIARATLDPARYNPESVSGLMGGTPALIDFETGLVSPLEPFVAQLSAKAGSPVPISVSTGPFARVVTPGDCVNVREAAGTNATVLACAPDGVLLSLREPEAVTVDGESWLAVFTPDGRSGWAAAAYLEVERGD